MLETSKSAIFDKNVNYPAQKNYCQKSRVRQDLVSRDDGLVLVMAPDNKLLQQVV